MKVVVARSLEVQLWVGELADRSIVANFRQAGEAKARQTQLATKPPANRELAAPFWTWFIENPRSLGTT